MLTCNCRVKSAPAGQFEISSWQIGIMWLHNHHLHQMKIVLKWLSCMFLKESSSSLLTFSERTVKFSEKVLFHCKEVLFFVQIFFDLQLTSDIAQFKYILVFWKIKVVPYLNKTRQNRHFIVLHELYMVIFVG